MADEDIEERGPFGSLEDRRLGHRPVGQVGLRNFDQGIVQTLRGEEVDGNYYIMDEGMFSEEPPPGQPGIPITFAFPDDNYEHWRFPCIVIRRDDLSPAMNRWHPGMTTSRGPAQGALPLEVTIPTGGLTSTVAQGFDRYEVAQQATPFDITYTISVMARYRGYGNKQQIGKAVSGTASPKTQANRLLDYVLRAYPPYGAIWVQDSLGDWRTYSAFMEATSHLDQVSEVADRMIGFAVTVRVEAELDLADPRVQTAVRGGLSISEEIL
jgi:hypothetical protein